METKLIPIDQFLKELPFKKIRSYANFQSASVQNPPVATPPPDFSIEEVSRSGVTDLDFLSFLFTKEKKEQRNTEDNLQTIQKDSRFARHQVDYIADQEAFYPELLNSAVQAVDVLVQSTFDQDLKQILSIPFVEYTPVRCPAVFRDIIVFYDNNDQVLDVLQLCFSCISIVNKDGIPFLADDRVYQELEELLLKYNHVTRQQNRSSRF